ncbi:MULTISPECIES: aminoglycoside adenylyltransferase domain-containing protein [Nocardioides]|uniref:Aminoglycoside adenylyltransferase domain-containing protein n=1 Tax=Nocardioides vastitatis TaxID=2568655 RepID=A0ABW0ZJ76_9ACTN|nr:aminoglycoside adenylyltransferase domain-containing protein [Nocardioides sp.]
MDLPRPVAEVCARFLELAPPGLVTGLYLRGGIGFGEWVRGQSDVDFVATLDRRPGDADVDALKEAHERLASYSSVPFDGLHVLASDLAADPRECPDVPTVLHGYFAEGTLDAMVAWHELALNGVTVSGPPLSEVGVWTSADALRQFTLDNLDTYWRSNAEALAKMPSEGEREEACCWCVLGVARLHHLLVTGEMTTKSGAGRWGLAHYDERWHRVLREALRIREGGESEYDDTSARGHDTAEFLASVVAEEPALRG